jgi:hypothetical protein
MAIPFAPLIARFNARVTNRLLGPIVWYLPSFGRILHVGRTSGKRYSAPIMAFRSLDRRQLTFALTYGPEANWVLNALAAGEVTFVSRWTGRVRLIDLRVIHDPARRATPWLIRRILGILRVDDFLEGTTDSGA